jgi:hypothetical protein
MFVCWPFKDLCIAAAAVALVASGPVVAFSAVPLSAAQASTMKAIVTASQPAIVTVSKPRSASEGASLELTVRPEVVARNEPYVVNVYMLPHGGQNEASVSGATAASFVGSFSFFPPARKGEVRAFILEAPDLPQSGSKIVLKIELVPAEPDAPLRHSALAIVDAKITD